MRKVNFIISFLVVVLFSGCSSSTKQPQRPLWITDTSKECIKNQICAVGSGSNVSLAKIDARNNILKYFETNVSSNFKSTLSSNEVKSDSYKSDDVQEVSSGILKGVEIIKTYNEGGEHYAFAILNKDITIRDLRSDLDRLDIRMKLLISENNPKYNKELENLYLKREQLNKRYLILTGYLLPDVVKYEDIFKIKKSKNISLLVYYITSSNSNSEKLSPILSSVILDNDANVVSSQEQSNRVADISIERIKMPLNIDGFVKYKYSLTIKVKKTSGGVVAVLVNDFIETGRSESQSADSAYISMKKFINENIETILK